jgi:hypothetical protein
MSSEQLLIEFSIVGQNTIGQATIKRNLSPRTFALIKFRLRKPIQSRVVVREDEINIPFKIGRVSPENAKNEVNRGDVAYWPQGQIFKIFLKNKELKYPCNVVGEVIIDNAKFFDKLKIGTSIKLEMIQPPIDEIDYI